MRGAAVGPSGERGFILIEVLVALAIALLALDLLYRSITDALRIAQTTAAAEVAVSRAQSHLAAIENPALVPVVQSGDDGDGYHWSTLVKLADIAPAPAKPRGGPWARGTALYTVSVTISWQEGRTPRRFVLSGALLGPVRGAAP
jgi:general secretion pathway protein I